MRSESEVRERLAEVDYAINSCSTIAGCWICTTGFNHRQGQSWIEVLRWVLGSEPPEEK